MNQTDLTNRLDALQNAISDLIEADPSDLDSMIKYYNLLRKQHVLEYYCKKEGYSQLGLHHIPPSRVSEHNAKIAIKMGLILTSLAKSAYANETWTLRDTSADLYNSPPKNCFKKGGYTVEVWFDEKPENTFPYTNWSYIYYQDDQDMWHKVPGKTDYNGLYFEERSGDKTYFLLFVNDAERYGSTNRWIVNTNNEQFSLPVTSFARRSAGTTSAKGNIAEDTTGDSTSNQTVRGTKKQTTESSSSSPKGKPTLRRRRGGERESAATTKRRRRVSPTGSGVPTASEVGRSHRSVARTNLSRLERLQAEARDPPILIVKGPANTLKCWRYRCNSKCAFPDIVISTVWHWVTENANLQESRITLAFKTNADRQRFIETTHFPKGSSWSLGSLDAL
ncbi:E2 [Gammapapillomavirus 9]|uniref:Regulatory protein E2 n=1 Tax=Gammapapillomavirus 9 TaxID=1175851 RepID=A0A2D2ALG6_9PAPI|nr:E2 [Gammapapillomavirus 9]